MKKKLEADLISIAHRILKLKNKSDIDKLYFETQKLYEKLAVLKFVEENFEEAKPTIGRSQIDSTIEAAFEKDEDFPSEKTIVIEEPIANKVSETPELKVIEEEVVKEKAPVPVFDFTPEKPAVVPVSLEDLIGVDYSHTQFVEVAGSEVVPAETILPNLKEKKKEVASTILEESKPVSLNEKLSKGFHIDLNDRIAFTKHLFGNNPEDYNRVLNQLITFDSFDEANNFLEEMVKPDYNNWEGKDEYAERFREIIGKKFS